MSIPTDKDLKKIIRRLKEAFKSSGGISEDKVNAIVQQKIDAALAKAEENMYKNISITTVSTGITGFGQTYTIQNDGLYLIRVGYITNTTGGNIAIRINGIDRGFKPCSVTGSFEYTVTYQLKKGDTISPRFDSIGSTWNGIQVLYMGRLKLTGN